MGQSVSIYFPSEILDWVDDQAKEENRSRSNQVIKILIDVKGNQPKPTNEIPEQSTIPKPRLPPTART